MGGLTIEEMLEQTEGYHATSGLSLILSGTTVFYPMDGRVFNVDRNHPGTWGKNMFVGPWCGWSWVDYVKFHNHVNKDKGPEPVRISGFAHVDKTAVIGVSGLSVAKERDNGLEYVMMKHMGGVDIDGGVYVGPLTTVCRSIFHGTFTRLMRDVCIAGHCQIGHGVFIDELTLLSSGVMINGSARIGKRCFVGTNSTVVQKVSICDDVMVGAGSVVVDNIDKPGKYYGVPARYRGKWDGEWKT
jgi:serine acetyltransferase